MKVCAAAGWNLQQPTAYRLRDVIAAINRGYGYRRVLLPVPVRPILALLQIVEKLPAPKSADHQHQRQGIDPGRRPRYISDFAQFGYPEEPLAALVDRVAQTHSTPERN